MRSTYRRVLTRSILCALVITVLFLVACKETADVYSPAEWAEMWKKAGGWTPLPFPDSKYRPGAIIKVTETDGIRWVGDFDACRYPKEAFKPEKSYIPGLSFTKEKAFGAKAMINIRGITAGPAFDKVSKVNLQVQDHGADSLNLIALKVWWEDPNNRKKVSPVCMDELKQTDRYLITEAFRVSKGTYTLYDKSGAAIELKAPQLGDLLQFQPDIKYDVTSDGQYLLMSAWTEDRGAGNSPRIEVIVNWDAIKKREKTVKPKSALDGVPKGLPALLRGVAVKTPRRPVHGRVRAARGRDRQVRGPAPAP